MPQPSGVASSHLPPWAKPRPRRLDATIGPERAIWRFRRAVDRIEPAVTPVLVEHAASYWKRPVVRHLARGASGGGQRVVWTIDGVLIVEFRFVERGPSDLVVHEFSLFDPLRKAIRTRHVRLRLAAAQDAGWRE